MNAVSLFVVEVVVSLLFSLMVVTYLNDVLRQLLSSACPREGGLFWMKTLVLLQFMAPLLLVVWHADTSVHGSLFLEFKSVLGWMLLGHCIALLLLARIIWRTMVAPTMGTNR